MSWLDTLEEIRKTDWSQVPGPEREVKAREVVNICAYAAAATSVVPIPLSELVLLLPVHSVMVTTVGHIHDRKLSGAEAKRVAIELGAVAGVTFAGGAAINALRKLFLPAIGGLVSVPATFALTWGLGRVSIDYFANPNLSREDLKKLFEEAMKEGKASFSKEAFDKFRQKNADVAADVRERVKVDDDKPADPAKAGDPAKDAPKPGEPAKPTVARPPEPAKAAQAEPAKPAAANPTAAKPAEPAATPGADSEPVAPIRKKKRTL